MKIPAQLIVGLVIVLLGGGFLGGEYFLVKWYPRYRQRVEDQVLPPLPYRNDTLGVQMQVAAGLYGKVQDFPSGVKIYRSGLFSGGPTLIITSQSNPDQSAEFSPQLLATWETWGAYHNISYYRFDHSPIQNRDAALISQPQGRGMMVTAHIISPDHIVEADCTTGESDVDLYVKACESSLRSIVVAGPMPPKTPQGPIRLQPVGP